MNTNTHHEAVTEGLGVSVLGNRVAATLTSDSRSEYQAVLEGAWAAVEAAHWSDAADAYQRATELLRQVVKTERRDSLACLHRQTEAA
jgi:hypothetical protein